MRAILESAARAGTRPSAPVRIHGEVGTGKETLARFIHEKTPERCAAPFVKIACSGGVEESIALALFGRRGGAGPGIPGALELAGRGTLFLEDVAELPARLQVELLRIFKTGHYQRASVGQEVPFEARVMVASVVDLAKAVRKGVFRSDLFHRFDVLSLQIPPLRHRREDIVPLARWFLRQLGREWVRPPPQLSPEAENALLLHEWPGNVRELRNAMESALITEIGEVIGPASLRLHADGAVEAADAFLTIRVSEDEPPPPMAEIERRYIEAVLRRAQGNRSEASRILGLSYPTVTRKIAEFGIKLPE